MKWIKQTKSRLPEDGYYLVYCPNFCESDYQIGYFDNNTFTWSTETNFGDLDNFVTHWCELRQPEKNK